MLMAKNNILRVIENTFPQNYDHIRIDWFNYGIER